MSGKTYRDAATGLVLSVVSLPPSVILTEVQVFVPDEGARLTFGEPEQVVEFVVVAVDVDDVMLQIGMHTVLYKVGDAYWHKCPSGRKCRVFTVKDISRSYVNIEIELHPEMTTAQ